jgi:hypothetical protein
MSKHDCTTSTVSGAAAHARGCGGGGHGDYDPDPPEEHPDCGHDKCEEHWREVCYAEDDLVDTGCIISKAWKPIEAALDAAMDDEVLSLGAFHEIESFVLSALGLGPSEEM